MLLPLTHILAVAFGGAIGATLRYLMSALIGTNGIIIVNILGCFAIGSLVSLLPLKTSVSQTTILFLTVGLLGGFTTFSAFSLEAIAMIDTHRYLQAALYITLSVGGGLTAFILGRYLVKAYL